MPRAVGPLSSPPNGNLTPEKQGIFQAYINQVVYGEKGHLIIINQMIGPGQRHPLLAGAVDIIEYDKIPCLESKVIKHPKSVKLSDEIGGFVEIDIRINIYPFIHICFPSSRC